MCLHNLKRITNEREKSGIGYKLYKRPFTTTIHKRKYSLFRGYYHNVMYILGQTYEAERLRDQDIIQMSPSPHYQKGFHIFTNLEDVKQLLRRFPAFEVAFMCCVKVRYENAQYKGIDTSTDYPCVVANRITLLNMEDITCV